MEATHNYSIRGNPKKNQPIFFCGSLIDYGGFGEFVQFNIKLLKEKYRNTRSNMFYQNAELGLVVKRTQNVRCKFIVDRNNRLEFSILSTILNCVTWLQGI